MTKAIEWPTAAPSHIDAEAIYLSDETRKLAEAVNADIEALEAARERCESTQAEILAADPLADDPAVLERQARELRFAIARVLQSEIPIRERLNALFTAIQQDKDAARQQWEQEFTTASTQAREALHAAGFDISLPPLVTSQHADNYRQREDAERTIKALVCRHSGVAAVLRKIATLQGGHGLTDKIECTRDLSRVRAAIERQKATLMPAGV